MTPLSAQQATGGEREIATTEALTFPVIGTVLVTGAVVSTVCRPPDRPFTSWWSLVAWAVGALLLAAVAHGAAVWGVCTWVREQLQAPMRAVLVGMWPAVALLPVTVLLAHESSAAVAILLPLIAMGAVLFVRRSAPEAGRDAHAAAPAGVASGLFGYRRPPTMARTMFSAVLVAGMLEAGVAMLLSWQYALAGLLFGLCLMVLLWRTPLRAQAPWVGGGRRERRTVLRGSAVAFLLTVLALLPSLNTSPLSGLAVWLLGSHPQVDARRTPPPVRAAGATGGALSGVILTLPPKPRQTIEPLPVQSFQVRGAATQPLRIEFDGAYWYFRSPDPQPRPDARRVRGDPTKVQIRSTDQAALQMEAHQSLSSSLRTDCCSVMRVAVRCTEEREGAIGLELILAKTTAGESFHRSLGTLLLPSSLRPSGNRPAGEEVLTFAMSKDLPAHEFNEITVVVKPTRALARAGTHLAIEYFEPVGGP